VKSVVTTNCEKSAEATVPGEEVRKKEEARAGGYLVKTLSDRHNSLCSLVVCLCHEVERRIHKEACCPKHLTGSHMKLSGRAKQRRFFEVREVKHRDEGRKPQRSGLSL
jgi:hypothetical protein